MAQKTNLSWVALVAVAVVVGVAAKWWSANQDPQGTAAAGDVVPAAQAASGAASAVAVSVPVTPDEAALVAQQAAAAKEVERDPGMGPIDGPVTTRPAFVSEMEWGMLKGVAQQHPDPDKALTQLVNNLRFMKQLELYQAMPKDGDLAKRRTLAGQLLSELPQRVAQGDLDKKQALTLQSGFLQDLEPDPQARKARAEAENRRLVSIASP